MTYEEAIAKLVEADVAKWGESERAASEQMRRRNCPTIGLAVNALAHHDPLNVDAAMAAEAKNLLTKSDRAQLRKGG
jgi:hypothetical protein